MASGKAAVELLEALSAWHVTRAALKAETGGCAPLVQQDWAHHQLGFSLVWHNFTQFGMVQLQKEQRDTPPLAAALWLLHKASSRLRGRLHFVSRACRVTQERVRSYRLAVALRHQQPHYCKQTVGNT
jgi:hypothetical protein